METATSSLTVVTALGMLKRNVLEVMELEQAFTRLRAADESPEPQIVVRRLMDGLSTPCTCPTLS